MKLPKGWRVAALEEVAEIQTGLSKSERREGPFVRMPYLRVANVQDGHFDLSEIKEIDVPEGMVERFRVRAGDVLLTEGGDFDKLGRGSVWRGQIKDCVHQNHIFVVRPHPKRLDTQFFAFQTQSPHGRAYFLSCSKQSTNLASVNSTQLRQFPALLPPLPEQRKIADILFTWDDSLEKLDALIAAKERRKQGLIPQLHAHLAAQTRIGHAMLRLGDFVERVTRRNTTGDLNVLTISAQDGLISQSKYFNRTVAGADLSNYYLLRQGDFAYNRSTSNGYPYGAIKRLDRYPSGVVSTLYLCFALKKNARVVPNYLSHYFEAGILNSGLRTIAKEGARAHGLLNVTVDEFFGLDVFLPPLNDQRAIAEILDACDEELRLLRAQRAAIDRQKRGLMQRLLTGAIRVRTEKYG